MELLNTILSSIGVTLSVGVEPAIHVVTRTMGHMPPKDATIHVTEIAPAHTIEMLGNCLQARLNPIITSRVLISSAKAIVVCIAHQQLHWSGIPGNFFPI